MKDFFTASTGQVRVHLLLHIMEDTFHSNSSWMKSMRLERPW